MYNLLLEKLILKLKKLLYLYIMDIITLINKSEDIFDTIQKLSIDDLEKVLIYASDKYYNEEPVISDNIFDTLRDFLQLKAPKSKVLKQIGAQPSKSKDKVKLPYYLGSMDKIKPPSNKLENWKEIYSAPYVLSDKLDGVSALLVYDDKEPKLYTRGTATFGMDISSLLKYIKLPDESIINDYMKKNKLKSIAFRGELIINKIKFEKNWASSMKNARNAVSGLVNSKNINPELAHDTYLVLYQIIDPNYNTLDQLKIIKELGFKTVHHKVINVLSFKKLSKYLLKRRTKSKYIIDGIIITNNDYHPINKDGNPEYAWAVVNTDKTKLSKALDEILKDPEDIKNKK
jgi:NAD-dependent DNA ligase